MQDIQEDNEKFFTLKKKIQHALAQRVDVLVISREHG